MQKSPGLENWVYLIFTYYYYILKYGFKGKYTSLFGTFIETIHVCFFAQKWLILRPGNFSNMNNYMYWTMNIELYDSVIIKSPSLCPYVSLISFK